MFKTIRIRDCLRSRWERALFLSAALPALFFGASFEGRIAWLHSHDDLDAHVHLLASDEAASNPQALAALHNAEHGHEHDAPPSENEEVPPGFFLSIPPVPTSLTISKNLTAELAFVLAPTLTQTHKPSETSCRTGSYYRGDSHPRRRPSAVAALLLSNHALLI